MLPVLPESINGRRRIYLLRHGDVSYFDARGTPLPPRSVPLNSRGRAQAAQVGELLQTAPVDRVVTSGLPRTLETAAGIVGNRDMSVESLSEFEEITSGKLSKIPSEKLDEAFGDALHGNIERQQRFLGGESFGELEDRVMPRFHRLMQSRDWTHLLLVAHGGVNRLIISQVLGVGISAMGRIEQDPACLNVIDQNPDGSYLVRLINFTAYAPTKDGIYLTTMERIRQEMATKQALEGE